MIKIGLTLAATAAALFVAGCATQASDTGNAPAAQPVAVAQPAANCKGMSKCKGKSSCKAAAAKKAKANAGGKCASSN